MSEAAARASVAYTRGEPVLTIRDMHISYFARGQELLHEGAADVARAPGDQDRHQAASPGVAPRACSRFSRNHW